ncbi:hypothetical protein [Candidatus Sodalis pierantonius]|uniref:hypothetical protein n=1 Tax=Candidatus Sodalis pierantonii TaxID=1486991 RepID=UPI00046CDE06|nr:hypothetical protein [Candidatus Sodalis pierantonius]
MDLWWGQFGAAAAAISKGLIRVGGGVKSTLAAAAGVSNGLSRADAGSKQIPRRRPAAYQPQNLSSINVAEGRTL